MAFRALEKRAPWVKLKSALQRKEDKIENLWSSESRRPHNGKGTSFHCVVKAWPNARNISTQHLATLLGTCCVRLATLLRYVAMCCNMLDQI